MDHMERTRSIIQRPELDDDDNGAITALAGEEVHVVEDEGEDAPFGC